MTPVVVGLKTYAVGTQLDEGDVAPALIVKEPDFWTLSSLIEGNVTPERRQSSTLTEKEEEVWVSAPPFVVTETSREVKAIAFAVSTVIAPL